MPYNILRRIASVLLFWSAFYGVRGQQNDCDGPYVFYIGNTVIAKSVINDSLRTDTFSLTERYDHLLKVHFSTHPEWDFSFKLHALDTPASSFPRDSANTIFFSDIEGEFEPFREMLIQNKVIDEKYNWIYGKGSLVIAGDLFDRGDEVTSYLWLLYKLEGDAKKMGGAVHVILGNHEIMNLSGDTRYVQPKYFYNAGIIRTGYNRLFAGNTELGRWLRSKNIVERIGDILVLHGGLSPDLLRRKMPLDSINWLARPWYDKSTSADLPSEVQCLFNSDAPFWYRGYFLSPLAGQDVIDSTLMLYNCKRIIVGHNIIDKVKSLYDGKVVGIDVNEHEGMAEGLLVEGSSSYFTINKSGDKLPLQ